MPGNRVMGLISETGKGENQPKIVLKGRLPLWITKVEA